MQAKPENGGYETVAITLAFQNVSKDRIKLLKVAVNGQSILREGESSDYQVVVLPGQMHRMVIKETRQCVSEKLIDMQVQYSR